MSNTPKQPAETAQAGQGNDRRRFLGMGAKSVPFVVTVASQPALGVTCFTPSRSLSRNTSLSQKNLYGECTRAESPGNYKAQQDPSSSAYNWPFRPSSKKFHEVFAKGTTNRTLFIKLKSNGTYDRDLTFGEAINAAGGVGDGNVAFHVIGAYLNILGGNGAQISSQAMTVSRLQAIWSEYASTGFYEPMAGVPKWDGAAIVNYLKTNGIVA